MNEIKIVFVGDIFPGGVLVDQEKICDEKIMDVLMSADLRVATLESALGPGDTDGYSFDEEKMARPDWRNIIWAPDKCINRLKELHIDVVTIANNHIFDLGEKGLVNTIRLLDENGIKHCGAGFNKEDASKPAVVEVKGKKIAFWGCMSYFTGWRAPHPADVNVPGINIFDIDNSLLEINTIKNNNDFVFILPHWGDEYSFWPVPNDIYYSKKMIDAGADGVVGSHTHQVQPILSIKKRPICYSLGNFIFPDFYMGINRACCYPDKKDVQNIPITYIYERYPSSTLLRKWPEENRLGCLYQLTITDCIKGEAYFLKLSSNNIVKLYEDKNLSSKLLIISLLIRYTPYKIIFKYKSVINRIRLFFRK